MGPVLLRSQRNKIPRPLLHLLDLPDQLGEVFLPFNEVDLTRIDDQKWGLVIVEKIVVVSLREGLEILQVNLLFVGVASRFDSMQEHLRFGL